MVIARFKPSVFAFAAIGALFVIAGAALPVLGEGSIWLNLLVGLWLCLGGSIPILYTLTTCWPDGVALALDKDGLRWKSVGWTIPPRHVFIYWGDVLGVQLIRWGGFEEEWGLILGLREGIPNPLGKTLAEGLHRELEEKQGSLPWSNVVLLEHHEWAWHPQEVARRIEERLSGLPAM